MAVCPVGSTFPLIPFSNGDFEAGVVGTSVIPGWYVGNEQVNQAGQGFGLFSGGPNGQFAQKLDTGSPGSHTLVSGYLTLVPGTSVSFLYLVGNPYVPAYPDTFSSGTSLNQQVRVDVYDASDPRICSLADYLYDSASAEAGPYLGTLLPSVVAQANTGTGWQPFSGILGQDLVGAYGKPIVLAIRQVDNQGPFQFSIDSVSYA